MAAQESTMTTLDTFSQALHRHDWLYNYSDDHSVWSRGQDELNDLRRMIDELDRAGLGQEARALFNKVARDRLPGVA